MENEKTQGAAMTLFAFQAPVAYVLHAQAPGSAPSSTEERARVRSRD